MCAQGVVQIRFRLACIGGECVTTDADRKLGERLLALLQHLSSDLLRWREAPLVSVDDFCSRCWAAQEVLHNEVKRSDETVHAAAVDLLLCLHESATCLSLGGASAPELLSVLRWRVAEQAGLLSSRCAAYFGEAHPELNRAFTEVRRACELGGVRAL